MWESPREENPGTDLKVGHYKSKSQPRSGPLRKDGPYTGKKNGRTVSKHLQSCRDGAQRAAPLRKQETQERPV